MLNNSQAPDCHLPLKSWSLYTGLSVRNYLQIWICLTLGATSLLCLKFQIYMILYVILGLLLWLIAIVQGHYHGLNCSIVIVRYTSICLSHITNFGWLNLNWISVGQLRWLMFSLIVDTGYYWSMPHIDYPNFPLELHTSNHWHFIQIFTWVTEYVRTRMESNRWLCARLQ